MATIRCRFAQFCDINAGQSSTFAGYYTQAATDALTRGCSFGLSTGDNVNNPVDDAQWTAVVNSINASPLHLLSVPGNHEVEYEDKAGGGLRFHITKYKQLISPLNNRDNFLGSTPNHNYAFTRGGVRFIMLYETGQEYGSAYLYEDKDWASFLVTQLISADGDASIKQVVVVGHHPTFFGPQNNKTANNLSSDIAAIFAQHKPVIYLSGDRSDDGAFLAFIEGSNHYVELVAREVRAMPEYHDFVVYDNLVQVIQRVYTGGVWTTPLTTNYVLDRSANSIATTNAEPADAANNSPKIFWMRA